jgi:hypothetical protein
MQAKMSRPSVELQQVAAAAVLSEPDATGLGDQL